MRNGRKMVGSGSPPATLRQSSMGAPMSARSTGAFPESATLNPGPPLTPGGSIGRHQPLRRPQSETRQQEERSSDEHFENLEAQEVMRREVYGPHDALDLLYKAATDRYVFKVHFHLACSVGKLCCLALKRWQGDIPWKSTNISQPRTQKAEVRR
jgi:hypothetical protein